jgi:hypothetical protein
MEVKWVVTCIIPGSLTILFREICHTKKHPDQSGISINSDVEATQTKVLPARKGTSTASHTPGRQAESCFQMYFIISRTKYSDRTRYHLKTALNQ